MKFKRKVYKKDNTPAPKPALVDAGNNPINVSVGNGSEVIVQYSTYEWSNNYGQGIGVDLSGVQVLNLVEYKVADGAEFEPVEGYRSTSPAEAKEATAKAPADDDFDDDIPF